MANGRPGLEPRICSKHSRGNLVRNPACIASASTLAAPSPTSPCSTRRTARCATSRCRQRPPIPPRRSTAGLATLMRSLDIAPATDRLCRPRHHGRHQHRDRAPRRAHRPDHHARLPRRAGDRPPGAPASVRLHGAARRRRWCRASAGSRSRNASMPPARCCCRWTRPQSPRRPMRLRRRACRRSPSASCTLPERRARAARRRHCARAACPTFICPPRPACCRNSANSSACRPP